MMSLISLLAPLTLGAVALFTVGYVLFFPDKAQLVAG